MDILVATVMMKCTPKHTLKLWTKKWKWSNETKTKGGEQNIDYNMANMEEAFALSKIIAFCLLIYSNTSLADKGW